MTKDKESKTEKKTGNIVLDERKRREICAILSLGCSRRTAARYVGCSPTTLTAVAIRDKKFQQEINRAEQSAKIEYMRNIQQATKKAQYWRAAVWVLEHRYPEDYGSRKAGTVTTDQLQQMLNQMVEIIIEEVPVAFRDKLLQRFAEISLTPAEPDPPSPTEQ